MFAVLCEQPLETEVRANDGEDIIKEASLLVALQTTAQINYVKQHTHTHVIKSYTYLGVYSDDKTCTVNDLADNELRFRDMDLPKDAFEKMVVPKNAARLMDGTCHQ